MDDTQCYSANNSRLVRDDENDKSGSDEESRDKDIGFSKVTGITKQQQVLEAVETVAESEESDEEMRQWEEEQINKGVKIIQATRQPVNNSLPTGEQSFGVGTGAYPYVEAQTNSHTSNMEIGNNSSSYQATQLQAVSYQRNSVH